MTYNVSSGTLSLYTTTTCNALTFESLDLVHLNAFASCCLLEAFCFRAVHERVRACICDHILRIC